MTAALFCLSCWQVTSASGQVEAPWSTFLDTTSVAGQPAPDSTYHPESTGRFFSGNQYEGFNTDESGYIPPDPNCAVGPSHIVIIGNSLVEWFTKDGANRHRETLNSFFDAPLPDPDSLEYVVYDPKILYDYSAQRFVIVALEGEATSSTIWLAVSLTVDPSDGWLIKSIDSYRPVQGVPTVADYPGIGVGASGIYITTDQLWHQWPYAGHAASWLWIVDKAQLCAGTLSYTVHDAVGAVGLSAWTTLPTQFIGTPPVGVGTYLLQYSDAVQTAINSLSVITVDTSLTNPSFSLSTIDCGNIDTSAHLPGAPQPLEEVPIDTGLRLVYQALWSGNQLWATCHVVPPSGPDAGQTTAHWWRIDTSVPGMLSLADQGDIGGEDLGPGTFTYYPSVAVDSRGNAMFGFAASSENLFAGAYVAGHLVNSPPGSSTEAVVLAAGQDAYQKISHGRNRWGDFSGIAVDPVNMRSFWAFNEYPLHPQGSLGRWGTRVGRFSFPDTLHVPGQYLELQAAVDSGIAGDVVLVDGENPDGTRRTYSGPLTFTNVLRVVGRPEQLRPILAGAGMNVGVVFPSDSQVGAMLEHFEIRDFAPSAVEMVTDATATTYGAIEDCVIVGDGAGNTRAIGFDRGILKITNTTVDSVQALVRSRTSGGGAGSLLLRNCAAFIEDGVDFLDGTTVTVENCTIRSVYDFTSYPAFAFFAAHLSTLSLRNSIISDFYDVFEDIGSGCPTVVADNLFYDNQIETLCTDPDRNLVGVDPLFCHDRDPSLPYGLLRIDSPAFAENNQSQVDIGWNSGERCAWGELTADRSIPPSKVHILEDISVPAGLHLTLLPGVTMAFDGNDESASGSYDTKNELIIEGSLVAGAATGDPVVFTSDAQSPEPSDWGTIEIKGPASVHLLNAVVEYGNIGVHYMGDDSQNAFEDVTFRHNDLEDVRLDHELGSNGPAASFNSCVFEVSGAYGLRADWDAQGVALQGCVLSGNSVPLAGIRWLYSGGTVSGGSISGFSMGSGVQADNATTPDVQGVAFEGNKYGVQWCNSAGGTINECTFNRGSGQATDLWIRDTAAPTITNNILNVNSGNTGVLTGDQSSPTIGPGNVIHQRKYGISAEWGSTPRIRGNAIDGCFTAVKVAVGAQPDLGTTADPGDNSITGSTFLQVDGGRNRVFSVMAEENWWGSSPPDSTKFTAFIDYDPWLTSPPGGLRPASSIGTEIASGDKLSCQGAFPNPFFTETHLRFHLPEAATAKIEMFDVRGRLVWASDLGPLEPGNVDIPWRGTSISGASVSPGIYWYRFRAGRITSTGHLTVLR